MLCITQLNSLSPVAVPEAGGARAAADRNQGGVGDLAYPLVSDLKREITTRYNVLTPDGVALRGLFIIDKEVRCPHCFDFLKATVWM